MRWTVYGLRLKGDREVRYIGQTQRSLEDRLFNHFSAARHVAGGLCGWLRVNADEVEAFKIAYTDNLDEARATERVVIALCLRLNHRLFNRAHVPAELRLVETDAA